MSRCLLALVLILSLSACDGTPLVRLHFWKPIHPEADALVEQLELNIRERYSSEEDTLLAQRLIAVGDSLGIEQIRVRGKFFDLMSRQRAGARPGDDSILMELAARTDSVSYPYDLARINVAVSRQGKGAEWRYPRLLNATGIFESSGDYVQQGDALSKIAYELDEAADTMAAISYTYLAEKAYEKAGDEPRLAFARYHRMKRLNDIGDTVQAYALLDTLLSADGISNYRRLHMNALIIKGERDGSIVPLWQAASLARGRASWMRLYCYTVLAHFHLKYGNMDSMRFYADSVKSLKEYADGIDLLVRPEMAEIFYALGDSLAAREQLQEVEAINAENRAARDAGHLERERHKAELAALSDRTESHNVSGVLWCVAGLVLVVVTMVLVVIHKTPVVYEHGPEEAKEHHVARLSASISSDADWESVRRIFGQEFPEFESVLRNICPDLTAAELRMATVSYLGLDTKHISRILAIAPDSVKKGRQRLRARLGLMPEVNLTQYLRSL
ncbi:MAG: hypothetical protein K2M79_00700 [Muribaculaceae bacterium]|nr:hypothetical protein [Muribaculaceae bacterium]